MSQSTLSRISASTLIQDCGDVTPGTGVAGTHVQLCDACLRRAMVETIALIDAQHAA
jgi:type 1 glutamine amidotransferase